MRKVVPWLLLAAVAAAVFYRLRLAPAPVLAFEVKPTAITAEVMGTGTLEARVKATISPRIQERLAEVLVDQNDAVKAGQILARLDDGELKRQVEVAEAALHAAKATAERIRVDEARAKAVESQAKLDHQRVADLARTQVSSRADLDKATEQLRVAESDLDRARAATAEAGQVVVSAERTLAYHKERLGFTLMVSPCNGLVTRRDRDPGGVVVPGSSILEVIATNEIWVSAWVDETASTGLAEGQATRVVFRSEPDKPYAGEVARLGRVTDRETREFLVDVRVRNLPPNWTLGQRAEVFIETGRRADVLVVPSKFLQPLATGLGVFVSDHGRATWREVSVGLQGRDRVEVVQGLSAGEVVVAPTGPKASPLRPGQRVAAP